MRPSLHFCKEGGVPTMLMVLSLPFIIVPFIYPLFKMCHLYRKIATINQLSKIESSSINYPREHESIIILTYQGTTVSTLLIKKILHLLILYIFFLLVNLFILIFAKQIFAFCNKNFSQPICDLSHFLAYHSILKNYLHPSPYVNVKSHIPTLNYGAS